MCLVLLGDLKNYTIKQIKQSVPWHFMLIKKLIWKLANYYVIIVLLSINCNLFSIFSCHDLVVHRYLRFWLFPDFIYRHSNVGKIFFKSANLVHNLADKVKISFVSKYL